MVNAKHAQVTQVVTATSATHKTLTPPLAQSTHGFTLPELLTTIGIIAILFSIAVPAFSSLMTSSRMDNNFRHLFNLLQYTRSTAVLTGNTTLICPTQNQQHCVNQWNLPLMIFSDKNNNQERDDNEAIERLETLSMQNNDAIYWRAYGSRRYIRYYADGTTKSQNGRITLCPDESQSSATRQIIIANTGRPRNAHHHEIREKDC